MKRRKTTTSDKALAAMLPLFTAWCARYAWGWLAGLEAIAAAGFGAWKVTNIPPKPWQPPEHPTQGDAGQSVVGVLLAVLLLLIILALLGAIHLHPIN